MSFGVFQDASLQFTPPFLFLEKSGNLSKSPEVAHPSGSSPEPPRTPLSWATSNLEDPRLASPGARRPETPSHQSEKGKLFSRSSWKNRCIHTIIYTFRTLFWKKSMEMNYESWLCKWLFFGPMKVCHVSARFFEALAALVSATDDNLHPIPP